MKLAEWRTHPLVVAFLRTPPGQLAVALYGMNVRDRALTLAGQAFIALVPLLIVLATFASSSDSLALADWLVNRFSLDGSSKAAVMGLFARPPGSTSGTSLIGILVVLVSLNSFAKSVQRIFEAAWQLPPRASHRAANGVGGALVLLTMMGLLAYLTGLARHVSGGRAATVLIELAVAVPMWLLLSRLLLSGRVGWLALLPGAVVSAVGHVLTSLAGAIYIPHLIERNAQRYGVIGVAIALISWLIVLAVVVVCSAVVGAESGRWLSSTRRHPASPTLGEEPED